MASGIVDKNLDLAFEVIRQVVAEPRVLGEIEELSAEGTLVLHDPNDASQSQSAERIAAAYAQRGEATVPVVLTRRLHLTHR